MFTITSFIPLFATKLIFVSVGVVLFYLVSFLALRLLDLLIGQPFKPAFEIVKSCPKALSLYYSLRCLAVIISTGLVVCFTLLI